MNCLRSQKPEFRSLKQVLRLPLDIAAQPYWLLKYSAAQVIRHQSRARKQAAPRAAP